jgi:hypothetical protein
MAKCIVLLSPASSGDVGGGGSGIKRDKRTATEAATQATTVAWTWRRAKFPRMILRRRSGSSSSPMLAAVLSRADRFISRLPLRFMITGTITMSSPIVRMAFQRYPSVGTITDAPCLGGLTDTWSKSSPVNTRLTVVSSRVGALYDVWFTLGMHWERTHTSRTMLLTCLHLETCNRCTPNSAISASSLSRSSCGSGSCRSASSMSFMVVTVGICALHNQRKRLATAALDSSPESRSSPPPGAD